MPDGLVRRPRLVEAIRVGLEHSRLVLLSAPAGYGKTSLLTEFAHALPNAIIAWLALDEDDNDWVRFLVSLVAAVRYVQPHWGAAALAQLSAPGRPPEARDARIRSRRVIGALINDLLESRGRQFVLVLDDLHHLTEATIYATLEYLLEYLPRAAHLVVATREAPPLPLARLRARGDLTELHLTELCFTSAETAALLNDQFRLGLSAEELALVHARIEGWPAALRIVASSLQQLDSAARRAFVVRLPSSGSRVFDYLAEEILNRQTPEMRAFFLETSILAELTPAGCRAVSGRHDALAILEDLQRRNLVVELPGESGPAFRYHDLLTAFLRQRLTMEQPDRVTELYCRAAAAEPRPDRAINYYLAAGQWEQAARTIERVGRHFLYQGFLDTLQSWIQSLPTATRVAHPHLLYLLGACARQQGNIEAGEALLRQALSRFEAIGDEAGVGEALAELANCTFLLGDFQRLQAIVERALSLPLRPESRVELLGARSLLAYIGDDWISAAADFAAATEVAQTADDDGAFLALVSQLLPGTALLPGGLQRVERICLQAEHRLGPVPTPLHVIVETQLAFLSLLRAEPQSVLQHGQRALDYADQLGYVTTNACDTAAVLAVISHALGDEAAADQYFEALFRYIPLVPAEQAVLAARLFLLGRVRWSQGRLDEAHDIYRRMIAIKHSRELSICPPARAMMRGLLELSDGRDARAERCFRQALLLGEHAPALACLGNPRVLLALLHWERGQPEAALAELTPVMADLEQRGWPGLLFVEGPRLAPLLRLALERGQHPRLAARLLEHLATHRPAGDGSLPRGQALTAREVEILRLITTGQSNRAIAEHLVITENTTKAHLYRIFRKLGVSSRAEAAARARALGLA